MTVVELRKHFNDNYGISLEWPRVYETDHETFINVFKEIINYGIASGLWIKDGDNYILDIKFGPNKGLLYKGVEITIKK